jgi:predicted component of viral defense system (DUF524 family)
MPLTNSDMVYNNEFLRKNTPEMVFSASKKEDWKNSIKMNWFHHCRNYSIPYRPLNLQEQCSICFDNFYQKSWMLKSGMT